MTTANSGSEREEVTVRFPTGMLDRIDDSCRSGPHDTRSEFVSEALERATGETDR